MPRRTPRSSRSPRLTRSRASGGCTFAADAERSFDRATVIWTAAIDPGVLTVTADKAGEPIFDLGRFAHAAVRSPDGREHVAISAGAFPLRLDVVAGSILDGPAQLSVHLDCTRLAPLSLLALDHLLRLLDIRVPGRRRPPRDARLPRLAEGLNVIDAIADGAGLREIAEMLGDAPTVRATWPGDGEWLKSRARRRVALARRLLDAGPAGVLNYRI